jgi:hypothetical protein
MGERHRWMIVKPGCGEKKRFSTEGTEAGALRTRRRLN